MRHADASSASGAHEQVPKAVVVLQGIAAKFPDEPAFLTYSSKLSLNAVKHAIGRASLTEAAGLHAGLRDLVAPSTGDQSLVADFAEASVALCFAYQGHGLWEELSSLAKTTEWALRSEAFRERMIAKGGEKVWTETAEWMDEVVSGRWNPKKSKNMKWRTVQLEKIQKHERGGPYNEKKSKNMKKAERTTRKNRKT